MGTTSSDMRRPAFYADLRKRELCLLWVGGALALLDTEIALVTSGCRQANRALMSIPPIRPPKRTRLCSLATLAGTVAYGAVRARMRVQELSARLS